mgnify:CR=1 FL=1
MTDSQIFNIIAGVVVSYLIGSFSSAVWIGKWFFNTDVRLHGSGNAGATNTIRVLGPKVGLAVLLLDVFKGWLAVSLVHLFVEQTPEPGWSYIRLGFAVAVVLGHILPIYTGFKGGKGVATLLGICIALFPLSVVGVAIWFFVILFAFGYVSLSSVTSALLFPFFALLIFPSETQSLPLVLLSICIAIMFPSTHHKNIKRLLNGTEQKFKLKKSVSESAENLKNKKQH